MTQFKIGIRFSMSKNLYAVLLAGGAGRRFWPLSRRGHPKQFLSLLGKHSLFEETLRRALPIVAPTHIYIVTNAAYRQKIKKFAASFKIPASNILWEPTGKNTAPSICWAAAEIAARDNDGIMLVLPSDHLIFNQKAFREVIGQAINLARRDYLVTLGIVPTRPETGYGYLKTTRRKIGGQNILKVERFVEKPSPQKAKQFLRSKGYLWNSGMFAWRAFVILDEFKKHLPQVSRLFGRPNALKNIKKIWRSLPSVSIDYGVLEKSNKIVAVSAGKMQWSDVGSWEALADISARNRKGNSFRGDVVSFDCQNTFVLGKKRLIATIGLKDVLVIDTPDSLLVCRKDMSQKVKEAVAFLAKGKYRKHTV